MKFLLLISIFLLCSTAHSQTITYFNEDNDTVTINDAWSYYIQLRQENLKDSIWIEEKIDKDGRMNLQRHFYFDKYKNRVFHGGVKEWYADGQLKKDISGKDGKLHGIIKTYWPNGQLKRDDFYESNTFISGKCYDSLGKETGHYQYMTSPSFKGGSSAMIKFIRDNLIYPELALENGIEGEVIVYFIINKDGSLSDFSVKETAFKMLDNEAFRVVKLMENKWIPGYEDGEALNIKISCPVRFSLR